MEENELKHVITLLLEDAKRLQELEPNAGTEARIGIATFSLQTSRTGLIENAGTSNGLQPSYLTAQG